MAEYVVNRLDFNNDWQMHKGLGYFAMNAVNRYLSKEVQGERALNTMDKGKINSKEKTRC